MAEYPSLFRVSQCLDRVVVEDIEGEVRRQLDRLDLQHRIARGQTVAITAGSRGIGWRGIRIRCCGVSSVIRRVSPDTSPPHVVCRPVRTDR